MGEVSSEFAHRISTIAEIAGHLGVQANARGGSSLAREIASSLRDRRVSVPRRRRSDAVESIGRMGELVHAIHGSGPISTGDWSDFWSLSREMGDVTAAGTSSVGNLADCAWLAEAFDPFVMGNIKTFLGRRGISLVRNVIEPPNVTMVVAFVGKPDAAFLFARVPEMQQIARLVFERCQFSDQYTRYAAGAFSPLSAAMSDLTKARVF